MNAIDARYLTAVSLRNSSTVMLVEKAIEDAVKKVNCYTCTVIIPTLNSESIEIYYRLQGYNARRLTNSSKDVKLILRWDAPV